MKWNDIMGKTIITGASGPLGIMLIQECIKNRQSVLAIVRPGSQNMKNIPNSPLVKTIEFDISEINQLPNVINEQYDTFYHLAWSHTGDEGRNDPILQAENIQNTLKAAECAKKLGCRTFVGTGSQAEYGIVDNIIDESTRETPVTLYGITKLAAGRLAMEYCRQNHMRCNWIRIFAVYGPYENSYIFTSYVIRSLLRDQEPILTPCEQKWDYLYCEDAARAILLVGEKVKDSGTYCLGSGRALAMKEYVFTISKQIGNSCSLGIGKRPYGENQIFHLQADISKLKRDTGFEPVYSFEKGIAKTIEWYKHLIED
jgi:nucleoside-diphosphate-sugar epimerase